ncbi:MAG: type VI secretion system protein TssA [Alphaproteobacteria bacterium]|nr:type VI secretion system protein TssA [Alphaproteobacteria bacterium]
MPLDSAALLAAVSEQAPAGPNLEFDPDFTALERAAQGKPEQQYGDTIIPGEEPDWKEVEAQSSALLERTRDLRVLAHLAVARLHLRGLVEYAEVLALTQELLQERWAEIHPQLDPEDDNDPTLRANALLRLAHPGLVLRRIRDLPLASSPRLGHYSWRDVAVALGAIEGDPNKEKPSETLIRSAFQESDPAGIAALRAAAAGAKAAAEGIGAAFDAHAGYGTGPDFDELTKLLAEVLRTLERYAAAPAEAPVEAPAEMPAATAEGLPGATAGAAAPRPAGVVTAASLSEVTTRADALRLLDLACQYYRRYEPSSPLPLLVERARSLADKDFIDILRELAPDGLMQAQMIVSSRNE